MAVFSKEEGQEASSETIIGPSVKVEGNFNGEGNIIVQGQVQGNLTTTKDLEINEGAKIEADIEAQNIKVSGEITGNIKCHGTTELLSSAKVNGDVDTDVISIENGAQLNGKCTSGVSGSDQSEPETTEDDPLEETTEDDKN